MIEDTLKNDEDTKIDGVNTDSGEGDSGKKKKEKDEEEMVEVKKSDLNRMLKQLDKQSKDIDLLYRAGDKGRLAREMNKEGTNLIKQCKVRTWNDTDALVVGWKLKTNRCEVIQGKWIEEQTTSVVLDNGDVEEVPLIEFYRKTLKKVTADIIGRSQESDGVGGEQKIVFKLQFPNGKVILLDSTFVN